MKTQAFRRNIWFFLAALWMLFIWSNSLHTAAESSAQSRGVLDILLPLVSWTGLPEELLHTLLRKLGHLTEFAFLGLLWSEALYPRGETTRRALWLRRGWTLFICMTVALTDETIQRFVPGRSGEVLDVWIDALGGVLGILAAVMLRRIGVARRRAKG